MTTQSPSKKTVDLAVLSRRVGAAFGSTAAARAAVHHVAEAMAAALRAGEPVHLKGLGRFEVVATPARSGRNPKTGEPHLIPAGRRVKFRARRCLRILSEGAECAD
ncbi:MAG: HU family DNA-binding protein [Candidatus Contendobacter sp.]|nr:HU family DNA-binding protein [Candidatus Contendobacter sp.]